MKNKTTVKLQVTGAQSLPVERQAEIIRLNPGIEGLSPEAYERAKQQDEAGVPLPEVANEIPVSAQGADFQVQGDAAAEAAAQNQEAAKSTAPVDSSADVNTVQGAGSEPEKTAAVTQATLGDEGWLVKFCDKVETHFFATQHELEAALEHYVHDFVFPVTRE